MSGHTPFTDWDQRDYPGFYQPVQLDPKKFDLPLGFIDWWSPRSTLFCTCQPCLHCCNGETLVCMTDGYWEQVGADHWLFRHDLPQTWSRDKSVFGYGLGIYNAWKDVPKKSGLNDPWRTWTTIEFNLALGKARLNNKEWAFRIDDDEWQKPTYNGSPGEPNAEEIWYMYRWRRVIRGDGSTTPAFQEMVRILDAPYPHRNCLQPWCPCWPCCISKESRLKDMAFSNRQQLIIWRPEHRKSTCVCYSCKIPCPCMCPVAAKVDGKYAVWVEEIQGAPTQQLMSKP